MSDSGYPPVAPRDPEFGQLIAYAGPESKESGHSFLYVLVPLIGGIIAIAVPFVRPPKPEEAGAVYGLLFSLGGLAILIAALLFFLPALIGSHQIILYEKGLIERIKDTDRRIPLAKIERVRLHEWFDDRFSPQTWNVVIVVQGEAELRFSSKLVGGCDQIIGHLAQNIRFVDQIAFRG